MPDSMTGFNPNSASSYNNDFPSISPSDYGGSAKDYATSLSTGPQGAYNTEQNYATGMAKPMDIYNTLENQNGMPTLRATQANLSGQVNNLEDTINNVENNVNANTGNSMVTEGQRQNMITQAQDPLLHELAPLSRSLGQVGDRLTNAEATINNQTGYAVQGENQQLGVLSQGVSMAQDNANRQMAGFTTDQQLQYQTLLAKIQRGEQLSDEEKQYAQQLQIAKNNYDYQTNLTKLGQTYQSVWPGGSLVNTMTGKSFTAR